MFLVGILHKDKLSSSIIFQSSAISPCSRSDIGESLLRRAAIGPEVEKIR